jgi:hypothetical protein
MDPDKTNKKENQNMLNLKTSKIPTNRIIGILKSVFCNKQKQTSFKELTKKQQRANKLQNALKIQYLQRQFISKKTNYKTVYKIFI